LLAGEHRRIEEALETSDRDGPLEATGQTDDRGSEDLYQDEVNEGRGDDLRRALAAAERAEARLAAGTYGISVESGASIPDGRVEAGRRPSARSRSRSASEPEALLLT
jgi:RNA polymerase-binding transcription factor DksA